MAALWVQLVKYALHLLGWTIGPAAGAQRLCHVLSGSVVHVGRDGLRQAILGRRRERRGLATENLAWL